MQSIHQELIALMPNAMERPNEGQMVLRDLQTWDDHEAARVTLERFGHKAIAFHVQPDHITTFRAGRIIPPTQNAIHIEFDPETGHEPVRFYNDLPESMGGWRAQNAALDRHAAASGWAPQVPPVQSPVGFEDFVEELRRNNVRLLLTNGQMDRYRERTPNRWSVPVYDFGGLIQPSMPDYLGDDLIDKLLAEAPANPDPLAPACVFIQRFKIDKTLDPDQSGLATMLLRVEGLTETGGPNITFAAQHHTHWMGNNGERLKGHWRTMEPKMADADPKLTGWYRRWASDFIALLAGWREDIEFREANSPAVMKINAKRKLARQTPISPTKVIHIAGPRIQYLREGVHGGIRGPGRGTAHASPHEHLRTICSREISYMRNGKEVRYRFKKAGQRIEVKPRGPTNPNRTMGGASVHYQVVR